MYTLYIANKNYSSWSLRPWALLTELGIPFEEKLSPFGEENRTAFRAFSPSGRVPSLHDGETIVWDSLAIVEYLAERHPGVWPQEAKARAWARSASAEMHAGFERLRGHCSMSCGVRIRLAPERQQAVAGDLARLRELWEEGLDRFGGPFLAGASFTGVDAFYAPVIFRIRGYGLDVGPKAGAYVERMLALRSLRAWDEAALREPWREPGHEEEILGSGELLADLRAATSGPASE